jgi:hypothetical protein
VPRSWRGAEGIASTIPKKSPAGAELSEVGGTRQAEREPVFLVDGRHLARKKPEAVRMSAP